MQVDVMEQVKMLSDIPVSATTRWGSKTKRFTSRDLGVLLTHLGRKVLGSGYQQKDRKPSQNDKTEHGMEKTVQNQGQSPKMPKSESILKNQQSNRSRN
ncbi:hypothetical protein Tco_1438492 [Tanacetum coccineum]